jgi:hypothetical protein
VNTRGVGLRTLVVRLGTAFAGKVSEMRSTSRRLMTLLFTAVLAVTTLIGAEAAPDNAAAKPWQLIDNHQKACYVSTRGGTNYYGIWISGTWKRRVNVGADALPAGGSYYTSYAPIPAGSSDGVGTLAYVAVVLPTGTAVGTYTSSLWASDGKTKQRVRITEVVQATSCSHY